MKVLPNCVQLPLPLSVSCFTNIPCLHIVHQSNSLQGIEQSAVKPTSSTLDCHRTDRSPKSPKHILEARNFLHTTISKLDNTQARVIIRQSETKVPSKGSIRNYFAPVQAPTSYIPPPKSSSPISSRSLDSDRQEISTPPTSPSRSTNSPSPKLRLQKARHRRLTIKPQLLSVTMSTNRLANDDVDDLGLLDFGGQSAASNILEDSPIKRSPAMDISTRQLRRSFGSPAPRFAPQGIAMPQRELASPETFFPGQPGRSPTILSARLPSEGRLLQFQLAAEGRWAARSAAASSKSTQSTLALSTKSDISICPRCNEMFSRVDEKKGKAHDQTCEGFVGPQQPGSSDRSVVKYQRIDDDYNAHEIIVIKASDKPAWKNYAERALQFTFVNLGGAIIESSILWSDFRHARSGLGPRFKVYVHCVNSIVIAVILAESIDEGIRCGYQAPDDDTITSAFQPIPRPSAIDFGKLEKDHRSKVPVLVSIDRIWVVKQWRRKGVATKLVDFIRKDFIYSMTIPKLDVAFSSPTDQGRKFAANYCRGINYGESRWTFLVNPVDIEPFADSSSSSSSSSKGEDGDGEDEDNTIRGGIGGLTGLGTPDSGPSKFA